MGYRVINGTTVADPLGIRDRAILETFYSTGMRRLELFGLNVYDIDTDRGVVTIRQGKGKKDRVVPIGARALAWAEWYRHEVRPSLVVDPNETAPAPMENSFGAPVQNRVQWQMKNT